MVVWRRKIVRRTKVLTDANLGWCDCYHWIAINDCNLIAIRYLFVKMSKNLKISHTECASGLRARLCAYRYTQSST